MTQAEAQAAREAGKARAAAKRRKASVARVKAYRQWLRDDVAYTMNLRAHEAGISRHPGSRPRMPAVPSDHEFALTDGRA